MINLDSVLKSRDVTLMTIAFIVKAMIFPVVMYVCESWTIKKAEHQRCFWIMVLEKTLESPLDCKIKPVNPKGNQLWIFIGRTDAEAPKLWPLDELTHWKRPWCLERLRSNGEGSSRGWDGWMASLTQWTWVWANLGDGEGQGGLVRCSPRGQSQTRLSDWRTAAVPSGHHAFAFYICDSVSVL